jgi:hypothetical protein
MNDENTQVKATLPPIPGSDKETLKLNQVDAFYRVRPREVWDKNQIVREEPEDFKKCEHFFIQNAQGVQCKKCNMGLVGYFEIQNGKLFHKGKAVGI